MDLQQKLVEYRRELHRYPELSMQEFSTTQRIKKWLSAEGIELFDFAHEVGVVAQISGKYPGPTIALRADIDALPVMERSGVDFASLNPGVMHACGHDFHTAVMIGAAFLLQKQRDQLHGTVRILFQPGEEDSDGAKWMIAQGAIDGVQAIFGFHNRPDLPSGTIGIREGALMAGVDRFDITVSGVGGHAGMPESCIDPIVTACQIELALQSIVSRRLRAFDNAVVSVTRFQAGNTWNVIPGTAMLTGTVRTFQKKAREKIPELMTSLAEGIASANGAKAAVTYDRLLSMVDNSPVFTDIVRQSAKEEGFRVVRAEPNAGGEDFSRYLDRIPGYFIFAGVSGNREWHHPEYRLEEDSLAGLSAFFARLAGKALDLTARGLPDAAED